MRTFKIIDLIIQCLIILATFILSAADASWITAMIGIFFFGSWHLVSAFIHLFFHRPAILRKERYVYWALVVIYFVAGMATLTVSKEYGSNKVAFTTLMVIACCIGIWYMSICLREVNRMDAKQLPQVRIGEELN